MPGMFTSGNAARSKSPSTCVLSSLLRYAVNWAEVGYFAVSSAMTTFSPDRFCRLFCVGATEVGVLRLGGIVSCC
jgi:hypothetical protein